MNIFFLSWDPDACAKLYCDQHVNKILLEIVQMLYTAWHFLGKEGWNDNAPKRKSGDRGYRPVSNPKHAMVMWVRSGRGNYLWTAKLGMTLAIEFNHRFGKIHACTKHIMWLYRNVPNGFHEVRNEKAYYSSTGFPPDHVTPVPECMDPKYHDPNLLKANYSNYKETKLPFARWKMGVPNTLQTEDTGKLFEMAICLAYGIPYAGKYKYSMEIPEKLKPRLTKLIDLFPMCRHTASNGARYDYTSLTDETKHLSAKSTKKGTGKVAPQVVGQSQPKKFCENIGIEYTTISNLKKHIQTKIIDIIPILVNFTFDCPNIYYNQENNTIRYITLDTTIEWNKYEFKWTCDWPEWKNSSTLKIIIDKKEYALLEFQFHTKSRTNMAIRWCYENFLTIFKSNLSIINF